MLTELKGFTSLHAPGLQLCGLPIEDDAESELTRSDAEVTCISPYVYVDEFTIHELK
jgi:hypothetical protein